MFVLEIVSLVWFYMIISDGAHYCTDWVLATPTNLQQVYSLNGWNGCNSQSTPRLFEYKYQENPSIYEYGIGIFLNNNMEIIFIPQMVVQQ